MTEDLNNVWSEDSSRIILSPSLFARSTLFYIQEIGNFVTYPTYYAARSNLDSYLLVLTLSGKGRLEYNGRSHTVGQDDIFFINCMKPHRYSCIANTWEFMWVHINGLPVSGYYAQFQKNNPSNILHLVSNTVISSSLEKLISLNNITSQVNEILSSHIISNILTDLLLQNFKNYLQEQQLPEFLTDALAEIDAHYAEPLQLDTLAQCCNVNMYHLSREFKRFLGVNFKSYLLNKRITEAKKLLRRKDGSIAEIAADVGFDSTSHFIEIFKKTESMTPLSYRNLWKNDR